MGPSDPRADDRLSTGIPGLDDILLGGLPRRRVYLLQGDPGAGKTTLCIQLLLAGARRGERGLYVSLSETREELEAAAASHGWSLDALSILEVSTDLAQDDTETTLYQPSEVELGERVRALLEQIDRIRPARIVLDSCSELRLLAESPLRYRRQILALKRRLMALDCTIVLIDNPHPGSPDMLLQSLVHGVISMEQLIPPYGTERRRLEILKLRGVKYRGGMHDYVIRTGGLQVFPRLVAAEHHSSFEAGPVPSGVAELDTLLGGGPERGSSILLLGPAGCGKSALATQYALAAAARGERAAMFSFDESAHMFTGRAASLGMRVGPHLAAGRITLQQVDPAELPPGEFAHIVRRAVEEDGARVVAIDSLNGYLNAMPEERFLTLQMHELLAYLAQQGVLSVLTVAQHGLVSEGEAPIDVSYLADSVLLFRYFEVAGAVRKALSVVKKRSGRHEATVRELQLADDGVRVGPVLSEFQGVLTGRPELAAPHGRTER